MLISDQADLQLAVQQLLALQEALQRVETSALVHLLLCVHVFSRS